MCGWICREASSACLHVPFLTSNEHEKKKFKCESDTAYKFRKGKVKTEASMGCCSSIVLLEYIVFLVSNSNGCREVPNCENGVSSL